MLKDVHGNMVDIIYDDPQNICPLEYVVWSFRYSTELSNNDHILANVESDVSVRKDSNALYFFKMRNSPFIKEFDDIHTANRFLFPNGEHHLFMTRDEIFEVISNYEPRFVER